jgi:hypothetical protein
LVFKRFQWPAIDTLQMARRKFPGRASFSDALCKRFGVDLSERFFAWRPFRRASFGGCLFGIVRRTPTGIRHVLPKQAQRNKRTRGNAPCLSRARAHAPTNDESRRTIIFWIKSKRRFGAKPKQRAV